MIDNSIMFLRQHSRLSSEVTQTECKDKIIMKTNKLYKEVSLHKVILIAFCYYFSSLLKYNK